jgi:radical SAM superfamily enzyme YgiQ (UPF0313 family)
VASAAADAGHEVAVLDLLLQRQPAAALRRALREQRPEVVGLSVRNLDSIVRERPDGQLQPVGALIETVRQATLGRDVRIVVGGSGVSVVGQAVFRRLGVDHAVIGEGEESFVALLSSLEAGRSPADLAGVLSAGGPAAAPPRPRPGRRLGPSGMERWIDWRPYERAGSTWAIQTKRGCLLSCSYCRYGPIEGGGLRLREPGEVVDEIERVAHTAAPRSFEFVDSTFNVPERHAFELCEEVLRRGPPRVFTAQGVNPRGASPELLALMERAGFNSFMISPDAACAKTLASLRKGFTLEDVHRARDAARGTSMISLWFFVLGAPGETEATIDETVSFAERYLDWDGAIAIFVTGVRILPDTEVARTALEQGQIGPDTDLSEPTFYFSPEVSHRQAYRRLRHAIARRPNIVHAAEQGAAIHRVLSRALWALGVPPPHWRFLPRLLRSLPTRELRRRFPDFARVA